MQLLFVVYSGVDTLRRFLTISFENNLYFYTHNQYHVLPVIHAARLLKKQLIPTLLLVLFLGYYGSVTLFYHIHIVGSQAITHSHPYMGGASGNPHHTHSSAELSLIAQLSQLGLLLSIASTVAILSVCKREILVANLLGVVCVRHALGYKLRGPPQPTLSI